MNISIKREQNNARISSAEREKFGAKLKTKNIFKALALAMLMPAMLLTTACSNDDEAIVNNETTNKKGYPLQVTVNVSREGDAGTRATYTDNGNGTGSLSFNTGDKLFVSGVADGYDYEFAGTLDYVPATGKFSGTIYTSKEWTGTADALFTAAIGNNSYIIATLLPAGYEEYGYLYIQTQDEYNDEAALNKTYTLATSKAAAVEQFSCELAVSYSSGFALAPDNAILNFTITGLAASTDVAVSLTGSGYTITKTVTTNGSGTATFGAGVEGGTDLNSLTLTVAGNPVTLVSSSKTLEAGKIYNITRNAIPGALIGQFSVSSTKKVYFSKGNLQYQASTGTWRFAEHQYDYVGNAAGNNTSSDRDTQSGWIDLFGWGTSGKSFASGYGSAYQPWKKSTKSSYYGPTGTNNLTGTYANGDWGVNMGSGWRTLTGNNSGEWNYLFNTRTVNGGQGSGHSYTKGKKVNNVLGVVLYPDDYTGAEYTTGANWSTFESAGCVFLPAAGWRNEATVNSVGSYGAYWSSTAYDTNNARHLSFSSNGGVNTVNPTSYNGRSSGYSVRLVHDAN